MQGIDLLASTVNLSSPNDIMIEGQRKSWFCATNLGWTTVN